MFVALRDLGQHRGVAAEGGFHVPAGDVAADRGFAVMVRCGVDQQQHANGRPFVIEHIAEARQTIRHLTLGLPLQSVHPIVP